MEVIGNYLTHEGIEYSEERLKEIRKKKYKSNDYWWVYVGGDDYAEMPLHVYVWNLHNPHARVKPNDGKLIHHKDSNKENNAPSNLYACKKCDHDRDHLTKRRKQHPRKFSKKTSSLGGKNAHKKHPELKDNLKGSKKKVKESVELVEEDFGISLFAAVIGSISIIVYSAVITVVQIILTARWMRSFRQDPEVSEKLTKIIDDGKRYIVRKKVDKKGINAFALPDSGDIVYLTRIKEVLNEREFYAILIHEVGHLKQKKQFISFKSWAAKSTVILIAWNAFRFLLAAGLNPFATILFVWVMRRLVLDLLPLAVSRYFEYDADSFAVKKGYGNDLASGLKKMAKIYNIDVKPCKTIGCKVNRNLEQLYSTHPQIANRIEGLLKQAELYKAMLKGGLNKAMAFAAEYLDIKIGKKAKKLMSLTFNKLK